MYWWNTLPEEQYRYGVTIADAKIDGQEIVTLYANPGNRGRQVPQLIIDNFLTAVQNAGAVAEHTSGNIHAEQYLYMHHSNVHVIGISNPKGPCHSCEAFFDLANWHNVWYP